MKTNKGARKHEYSVRHRRWPEKLACTTSKEAMEGKKIRKRDVCRKRKSRM
jgi:hypothetical protein